MAQESTNPFVLPGFGQQGEAARNPLFAGLDMMRQAWQNMAGAGGLDAAQLTPMSLEDLERRIRELQTVQNWLQLNATMLANTIQGLEIQRSTLKTLKSFAGGAFAGAEAGVAGSADAADAAGAAGAEYARAAGDWWNMVQQQFEHLASATAAGLQGMAESAEQAAAPAAKRAPARKKPAAAARKAPAGKSAAKKTARRTRA